MGVKVFERNSKKLHVLDVTCLCCCLVRMNGGGDRYDGFFTIYHLYSPCSPTLQRHAPFYNANAKLQPTTPHARTSAPPPTRPRTTPWPQAPPDSSHCSQNAAPKTANSASP